MPGFILLLAGKLKLPPWLVAGASILLALVAFGGLVKCAVDRHDSKVIEQHDTAQDNAILKKALPATERAADQRATDTTTIQTQREELRHADTPPPGGDGLSARQRRGCIVLRQQGARLADHPPLRPI